MIQNDSSNLLVPLYPLIDDSLIEHYNYPYDIKILFFFFYYYYYYYHFYYL